jgi:hypothetical protein
MKQYAGAPATDPTGQAPRLAVHTKLAVSAPGDEYEREANRVADHVMQVPDPDLEPQPPAGRTVCEGGCPVAEDDARFRQEADMGIAASPAPVAAEMPPVVADALRSPGQSLDAGTRAFFEPRFGHDFSRVRVHTDAKAAESARTANALAYTVGRHVIFGAGQYAPGTSDGKKLLAHELAHVVQQQATPRIIQREIAPGQPSSAPANTDDIDSQIALVQRAMEELRTREAEDDSGEIITHIKNLQTALTEMQRIKASGTSTERAQISNYFASVAPQGSGSTNAPLMLQRQERTTATNDDPLEREANDFSDYISGSSPHKPGMKPLFSRATGTRQRIQRQGWEEALIGGGIAAGPPGWVILAAAAVVVAIGVGVYVATRPKTREVAEERVEPRVTPREVPRTCATVYPAALRCDSLPGSFIHPSPQAALQALKITMRRPNLRLVSARASTSGPCPGVGMHYGVKDDGVYVASISCCPCCRDTPAGPVMTTLCRII